MLPGVVGSDRGGLSVEGIARGQICAINLVGNRYLWMQSRMHSQDRGDGT